MRGYKVNGVVAIFIWPLPVIIQTCTIEEYIYCNHNDSHNPTSMKGCCVYCEVYGVHLKTIPLYLMMYSVPV